MLQLAKIEELEVALAKRTNAAFVFIKPHACNDAVIALVKETLANEGIEVMATGSLDYKTIDEKMLIDNHYGATLGFLAWHSTGGVKASVVHTDAYWDGATA